MDNQAKKDNKGNIYDKMTDEVLESNYSDTDGLTVKRLNFGLWYVKNLKKFRQAFIILLVALSAIFWSYSLYKWFGYLIFGLGEDKILQQLISTNITIPHNLAVLTSPKDLIKQSPILLASGENRYDFLMMVENPNPKFYGQFNYSLLIGGKKIDLKETFILPSEKKYLMFLGKNLEDFGGDKYRIEINPVSWDRVVGHTVSDWNEFSKTHLDFSIDNLSFIDAGDENTIASKLKSGQLSFTAVNNTAFNYSRVIFNIFLMSGDEIVGADKYGVSDFMSRSSKEIKISWPGIIGRTTDVKVLPEIDIISPQSYFNFSGGNSDKANDQIDKQGE